MTSEAGNEVLEYDVRGQICPSTLLTALRAVNEHRDALRRGDLAIEVVTDHRDATLTIPEATSHMGYRVSVTRDAGGFRIRIEGGTLSTSGVRS